MECVTFMGFFSRKHIIYAKSQKNISDEPICYQISIRKKSITFVSIKYQFRASIFS